MDAAVLLSQGRSGLYHVEPLTIAAPNSAGTTADQIAASTDVAELGAMWKSTPALRPQIEARVAELKAIPDDQPLIGGTE